MRHFDESLSTLTNIGIQVNTTAGLKEDNDWRRIIMVEVGIGANDERGGISCNAG